MEVIVDIDQALHYSEILINKLENLKRGGNGARIHDIKCHLAVLEGYQKMLQDKQSGKNYPYSVTTILSWLNDGIDSAEGYLARLA